MKVYLATSGEYDDYHVVGIFLTCSSETCGWSDKI